MTYVNSNKFKYIDLFCGAGGLSSGFLRSGYECVLAIDNSTPAVATYKINFQDHIQHGKISEDTILPDTDLIIGGPPCQGFSSAGLRRTNDKRNSLVRAFSVLVANKKPKAFVFENVEGFLTYNGGNIVFDLLDPLILAGYRIHLRKINAANYGVPQHRKRVIAIGGLGWNPTFPEPTHKAYGAPGASKVYRHLPDCPSLNDALRDLPLPSDNPPGQPGGHFSRVLSEQDEQRIHNLQQGQTMKDLPPNLWHDSYRKRAYRRVMDGTPTDHRGGAPFGLRRLRGDEPSKAITGGAISEFVHPTEDRYLTLRECARIQTFPDDFEFTGTVTECAIQIGNAVPPHLAEIIAHQLQDDLFSNHSNDLPGALLSFIPTNSNGKSPILESLCKQIDERYFKTSDHQPIRQLELWP